MELELLPLSIQSNTLFSPSSLLQNSRCPRAILSLIFYVGMEWVTCRFRPGPFPAQFFCSHTTSPKPNVYYWSFEVDMAVSGLILGNYKFIRTHWSKFHRYYMDGQALVACLWPFMAYLYYSGGFIVALFEREMSVNYRDIKRWNF